MKVSFLQIAGSSNTATDSSAAGSPSAEVFPTNSHASSISIVSTEHKTVECGVFRVHEQQSSCIDARSSQSNGPNKQENAGKRTARSGAGRTSKGAFNTGTT